MESIRDRNALTHDNQFDLGHQLQPSPLPTTAETYSYSMMLPPPCIIEGLHIISFACRLELYMLVSSQQITCFHVWHV